MLLKRILVGVSVLLFSICCAVKGTPVIQGPSKVIFRPNEGPVELVCERNTTAGSTLWRLNGSDALTPAALVMRFSGHVTNGVDIQIVNATNNTEYICVSNVDRVGETDSEPVYLYVAAAPDIIGAVMINVDDATVVNDDDGDDDSVSFTLSWNEPFANFDPIVNYTVTINCTDNATCPVIVNTDNVTRTAFVNFITDLSMMTTLSVTATNTIGTSDPAITIITVMTTLSVTATNNVNESAPGMIIIVVPGNVSMVQVDCAPVGVMNQCTVTWNEPPNVTGAIPMQIYYNVSYSGENITDGYQRADMPMATINFRDNSSDINSDSDVNVIVTAMNVFGSGSPSDPEMSQIDGRSVINTTSMISNPDDVMDTYSVVVTCEINPTSTAEYCEVSVGNTDTPLVDSATIEGEMATVTINQLMCEQMYTIIAGGITDNDLIGPQFQREVVSAPACPIPPTPTPTPIGATTEMIPSVTPTVVINPPETEESTDDDDNTGAIVGGVVGGICVAILLILLIILICYCYMKKRGEKSSIRATSPGGEKGGTGVRVHTLDRYGKPIMEGDNTDTGVELTGYTAKSPEFTVNQVPSAAPATTFQGNDYQNEEKNRTPSAYVPEGSYDTLAPADEPTAPSAEVVPPANGQSNPNAPKLNYADLEQFTRKPASVKKSEPQPASQYAVIDPKSLQQQGTYT